MVWALYGLKSAGADFWNHLADCMHHLEILTCSVELDLWMKPMVRPEDGFDLIYADDVMVTHHDADSVLWLIYKYFKLKPSSIGNPDIYLGAKSKNMRLENGVWAWENILERNVKESVENAKKYLSQLDDAR